MIKVHRSVRAEIRIKNRGIFRASRYLRFRGIPHHKTEAKEGVAAVQTKKGGIPQSQTEDLVSILPSAHVSRLDRSPADDLSPRSIPTTQSWFWPRLRSCSYVYPRLEVIPPPTTNIGSTTSKHHNGGGEYPHQSYKADRLSWQTALPLYQATTTCHGPRFFVKEVKRRTLFGGHLARCHPLEAHALVHRPCYFKTKAKLRGCGCTCIFFFFPRNTTISDRFFRHFALAFSCQTHEESKDSNSRVDTKILLFDLENRVVKVRKLLPFARKKLLYFVTKWTKFSDVNLLK